MKPNWDKEQGKESLSLENLRHTNTCTNTHTLSLSTLTPVRVLHRCCLHLSLSFLEKYVKICQVSVRSDSPCLPFFFYPSSTSSLQLSSFPPLPLCCSRTSCPDTRTFKWKPPYFSCPVLFSSLFSLHSTVPLLSFPSLLSALAPPPPPPHSPPSPLSLLSASPLLLVSLF